MEDLQSTNFIKLGVYHASLQWYIDQRGTNLFDVEWKEN